MIVYGGRGASGSPMQDLWLFGQARAAIFSGFWGLWQKPLAFWAGHLQFFPVFGVYCKDLWASGLGRRAGTLSLSIKIAPKPSIVGSLGPKALKYESFEGKGKPQA